MKRMHIICLSVGLCLSSITVAEERVTSYTYTPEGLIASIDGPRTDVSDVTTFTYDAAGNRTTMTNALGHLTRFMDYDDAGRLLRMVDPNGLETLFTYNSRGWLLTRMEMGTAMSTLSTFDYDSTGNLTRVTSWPSGSYLSFTYDAARRLTDIEDDAGNRVRYDLDVMGNRVGEQITDSQGNPKLTLSRYFDGLSRLQRQSGDIPGRETKYEYDPNGNLVATVDGMYRIKTTTYDSLNRMVSRQDAPVVLTTYAYDSLDNLVTVTDPRGNATTYTHNVFGDVLTLNSPDAGVTTYTYDAVGNRTSQTDARGVTVTYTYDALNRVTATHYPNASLDVTFTYDQGVNGIGRLTQMADAAGSTTYAYDQRGNLTQLTRTTAGSAATVGYTYDTADRLIALTYPSGRQLEYSYDAQGQVAALTLHDINGGGDRSLATNVQRLPFGPVAGLQYGNGLSLSRTYDTAYRLTGQDVPGVLAAGYAYDAVDNLSHTVDALELSTELTLSYDDLDRLVAASGTADQWAYSYDSVGNRETRTINTSQELYANAAGSNRLLTIGGAADETLSYDGAGNLVSRLDGDGGGYVYEYSDANRLAYVKQRVVTYDPDGEPLSHNDVELAHYEYDGAGQRVRKITPSGQTRYVYGADGQLLAEVEDGLITREYVYLDGEPLALLDANGAGPTRVYMVHTDQLGAAVKVTDETGAVVWSAKRHPFGQREMLTEQIEVPFGFPGQYYDQESGLFYNYFRDYDPTTGRYIESDPIGLAGGLNTYTYALNNPIRYSDPKGLAVPAVIAACLADPPCAAAALAGAAATGKALSNMLSKVFDGDDDATDDASSNPKQCEDEKDNDLCFKNYEDDLDRCDKQYGPPLRGTGFQSMHRACKTHAFLRYRACLEGEPDPGPFTDARGDGWAPPTRPRR